MQQSKSSLEALRRELEWRLCSENPTYFFENYYYIAVVGVGAKKFALRDYQKEILQEIVDNTHIISLKARQIGMTTIVVGYALWYAIFHENSPWLFVSRGQDAAQKMLSRAKYAWYRLPVWMRDRVGGLVSDTQSIIEFPNGSYLESVPSTGSTGRGDSVFGVVMDECAFMDGAEDIWAAVEPLCYGKAILISTANGMGNFFHETWVDSEKPDSIWRGIFYPWHVVPSRDEKWYKNRRLAHRGREWYFYQEYPSNPSEAFAKSGRVAFGTDVLEYCDWREPDFRVMWYDGDFHEVDGEVESDFVLDIWEEPYILEDENGLIVQKPNYVVGCDVAEGLDHGDFTVVKVFDANTGEEVACSRSHIPVEDLGPFLEAIGYLYYTALIVVERNNHGLVPLTYLKQARYPRLYRLKSIARQKSRRRAEYGWYTNKASKPKMVKDFLAALRLQTVMLHDEEFRYEAQVFVSDGRGGYSATENKHDDDIMATLIAWQGVLDVDKYPIVWRDLKERPLTFDDVFNLEQPKPSSLLDVPIGRSDDKPARVTFVMQEANRRQK